MISHEVIIDGKTYVPKEVVPVKPDRDGKGIFRVTVERVYYDGSKTFGKHELDVLAGSWVSALAVAAERSNLFNWVRG